jgi:dTDP-3-amino-3,4,6-trideoxy-alpha-D-glucose transaminase
MKFMDLSASTAALRPQLDAAYARVMASGSTILGPEVEAFEGEFAAYCEAAHCVTVGNGLDALTLALRAAGVRPGQEVIVPSHTFIATWLAVSGVGARIVPVEVDPDTFLIDPAAVAAAVTSRTAAIIAVSLYGHPADMDALSAIAARHGLFLLEDAAQAHGARYRGRKVGSLAHATAFSFYPTKNLGALGDGGAVVTGDAGLAARLRRLRNYGSDQKYVHQDLGVNSRLDELQAGFLRAKLPVLDDWNAQRRAIAAVYAQELNQLDGVSPPTTESWAEPVYHLYVVRLRDRAAVAADLAKAGAPTLIHYPQACHLQGAYAELGFQKGDFPVAERLADEVLSLPMWPQMPLDDARRVSSVIRQSLDAAR